MSSYTRAPVKKYVIAIRLTKREFEALRRAAKQCAQTQSKWLGDLAREKLGMEAGK